MLTVGNGDIALTVDVSGLQTFPRFHELVPDPYRVAGDGLAGLPEQRRRRFDADEFQIPLRTQSTWGWYETEPACPFRLVGAETLYETGRGVVPYLDRMGIQRAGDPIAPEFAEGAWFHFNPRRAHLGRLALVRPDGTGPADPSALRELRTELDLWTGCVTAEYVLDGARVRVITVADPHDHRFATRVESDLLARGWGIAWVFDDQPDDHAPFELPLAVRTTWDRRTSRHWSASRWLGTAGYGVDLTTTGSLSHDGAGVVARTSSVALEVVVILAPDDALALGERDFTAVRTAAADWWAGFWRDGAAISLERSIDRRAEELERRIVLSQYLTAVNCAGTTPPAESGLTYNTWSGKFHLEMHWWHAAQFPLWGRGHLLERSIGWYHGALAAAEATARRQGYGGARWPKQTDPSARESPSHIGVFLIWQQPHIIYLLELLRREGRAESFLRDHYPLIEATAEFMITFVEERDGSFVLPPPLIPAQESYLVDRATNTNPTFELAYWAWALRIANDWRSRLGLDPSEAWDRVARNLARPTLLADGTYAAVETPPQLVRQDHPSMLMAMGWLPDTELVDPSCMAATLDAVWDRWDLQTSWGWDYPVMAMTAARLGDLGRAVDALLLPSPKNVFLPNGHNPQLPGFLSIYLPANGGLLAAAAHLVAAVDQGAELPEGWVLTAEGFDLLPSRPDQVTTT
ncbi:hypothetical protein [Microlunatus sp. GCM10028923]|uniref:hypothetical protein n=1 Tax=Microlunatus sp. GCM10028923 TaxID=3273400 RepID=UPI0036122379